MMNYATVAHAARNITMPTDQEKLDYLNEIVRTRGYAHSSHRLLANHDLDALKASTISRLRTTSRRAR